MKLSLLLRLFLGEMAYVELPPVCGDLPDRGVGQPKWSADGQRRTLAPPPSTTLAPLLDRDVDL